MFSTGFIQKLMAKEKYSVLVMIQTFCVLSILFTVIATIVHLNSLNNRNLNTAQQIEKFYNSNNDLATVKYDYAVDSETSFTITTTRQNDISFFSNGMGGSVPLGETKTEKEYYVNFLVNKDNIIIFCSDRNVDFSKKVITVSNKYKDMRDDVLADYADLDTGDKKLFVLYLENEFPILAVLLPADVLLMAVFVILRYSKAVQKRSRLGKKIAKIVDYDTILNDLNAQSQHAVFSSRGYVLTADYLIHHYSHFADVLPLANVKSVTVNDDEYPGEVYDLEISYATDGSETEETYTVKLYEEEDAMTIMNYIKIR